jgi:hypothetical protein
MIYLKSTLRVNTLFLKLIDYPIIKDLYLVRKSYSYKMSLRWPLSCGGLTYKITCRISLAKRGLLLQKTRQKVIISNQEDLERDDVKPFLRSIVGQRLMQGHIRKLIR